MSVIYRNYRELCIVCLHLTPINLSLFVEGYKRIKERDEDTHLKNLF